MESLRGDVKLEVIKLGPTNFEDAVGKARNLERALEEDLVSVNSIKKVQNFDINFLIQQYLDNRKIEKLEETVNKL